MSHPTIALLGAAALAVLVASIVCCVWADARANRRIDAERARGVTYVWRGTYLERIEPEPAREPVSP